MRLPSLLLSVLVVPATVLAAPVATPPGSPEPRPVAPSIEEIPLEPDAASLGALELGSAGPLVLTEPRSTRPFSTVGVTWAPGAGKLAVEVRTRDEQGWSDWTELDSDTTEAPVGSPDAASPRLKEGAGPAWTGPSDGVQVRVDVVSGAPPVDLDLVLVDPGSSDADVAAAAPSSTADAAAAMPPIRSRAAWGADESIRSGTIAYSRTIEAVTVHHTAGGNDYSESDVPAVLRGIYAFHVKSRGWGDIGYNVLVDKFGTAWEGRAGGLDRPVLGAHAGGFNTSTSGIAMMGTFQDLVPPPSVQETVAAVASWKLGLYGRDPGGTVTLTSAGSTSRYPAGQPVTLPRIFGHRDTGSTECPGREGYATLGTVRERASALSAGPQNVEPYGALESTVGQAESVQLTGWAIDPDSSDPVHVETTIDGTSASIAPVTRDRPEVQQANPPYPVRSGFDVRVPAPAGPHVVCLSIKNQQAGSDRQLGCEAVVVTARQAPPPPRETDDSCPPGRVPSRPFPDTVTSVHRAAIECAVWWEVAKGRANGTFGPAEPVSRGHMAAFLARTILESGGSLPSSPPPAFDDLGSSPADVRLAVEQLAAVGVVRGRSGRTFDPRASVTRGQMASFLANAYEYRSGRTLPQGGNFFDDDNGSVHENAIDKVAAVGFTGGTSGTSFSPDRPTERGQTASFATRVLDLLVEEGTAPRR